MSTSFHPQMNGAMEWADRSIGQMFRSMIKPDQKDWVHCCPMIEFTINSSVGNATKLAPFKINCGYMPTIMREVKASKRIPPGGQPFTQNAL